MLKFLKNFIPLLLAGSYLSACASAPPAVPAQTISSPSIAASATPQATPSSTALSAVTDTAEPKSPVPDFQHIVVVVFENKEFDFVVNNYHMAYFNKLAKSYTLLTQYYAVTHPSLPNYLAMLGGDTFGINFDCTSCSVNDSSLPDQIEASGRTWKAYEEDMPSPCFTGASAGNYAVKHDPFIYFMPIRLDAKRCNNIVPFTQLSADLAAGALPNFIFVTPNLCNDAHDCQIDVTDKWLQGFMNQIQPALDQSGRPYLLVLTWDEGQGNHSCCGLPASAGGRVATILVSPQAKSGFQDDTPYSHYSLLKTIESAWGLSFLRHAGDAQTTLIAAPWK
jgi:hypothetical protein